jgi:lipopolysaccharide transport system permease protein
VLAPTTGLVRLNLRDVWAYRELLYFLVWRDVKVRYKQTVLGAAWAILQPVMTMVVFSIFFGRFAKMPSDGVPYPVFAFAALLPWQLFAFALSESANSLVGSQNLITKVYFPRLIVPLASVLAGLVDFAIAFVVLLGLMWHYGIVPTRPSFSCHCSSRSRWRRAGGGLWLSSQNGVYRDVQCDSVSEPSSDCSRRRLPIPPASCPNSGARFSASTLWPASSKDFAGRCSGRRRVQDPSWRFRWPSWRCC